MAYTVNKRYLTMLHSLIDQLVRNGQRPADFAKEAGKLLDMPSKEAAIVLSDCVITRMSHNAIQDYSNRGVKKYTIESALTKTTCDPCRHLDGTIYKVSEAEEGVTLPPFHPNCKCTIIEVHDEEVKPDFSKMPKDYGGSLFDTSNMN